MERPSCLNCGAFATAAWCSFCGAVVPASNLVAAGFVAPGSREPGFVALAGADGLTIESRGPRALRVEMAPEPEIGHVRAGCAWLEGTFIDIDVSVTVTFEHRAKGFTAGVWLRSSERGAVRIQIHPAGEVYVGIWRGERGALDGTYDSLGSFWHQASVGAATTLRARLRDDLLVVYSDGAPKLSVRCSYDVPGTVDLTLDVPEVERSAVIFTDPTASIP